MTDFQSNSLGAGIECDLKYRTTTLIISLYNIAPLYFTYKVKTVPYLILPNGIVLHHWPFNYVLIGERNSETSFEYCATCCSSTTCSSCQRLYTMSNQCHNNDDNNPAATNSNSRNWYNNNRTTVTNNNNRNSNDREWYNNNCIGINRNISNDKWNWKSRTATRISLLIAWLVDSCFYAPRQNAFEPLYGRV